MNKKDRVSRRHILEGVAALLGVPRFFLPRSLAAQQMPPVTLHRLSEIAWQPLKSDFFPPGLKVKSLYEDKGKNTSLSVVRYPKRYHEPRHYHKGCGHWIYFLSGRLKDDNVVYAPGTFVYAPPLNVHGPFTAELQTDVLFFVEGPFDVFGA